MDVDQSAPKKEKKKSAEDLSEYKLDDYDEEETEAGAHLEHWAEIGCLITCRWPLQQYQGPDILQG